METETTNWWPGLVALAAGLGIAGLLIFLRRSAPSAPGSDLAGRDLTSRLEDLIAQLQSLPEGEEEQEERLHLELEAARVLRQLEVWQASVAKPSEPQEQPSEMSKTALVLTGAGLATAILLPVFLVIPALGDRGEGGSVTGNDGLVNPPSPSSASPSSPSPSPSPSPMGQPGPQHGGFGDLKARAEAHPDNVEMQLEMAGAYLRIGRFMEVFEASKRVLDRHPDHPKGLTFMAAVSLRMGKFAEAEEMIGRVLKAESSAPEAYLLLGMAQLKQNKGKEALASFERMAQLDPKAAPSLAPLIRQAQQAAGIDAGPPPPSMAAHRPHGNHAGHDHAGHDHAHHAHAHHNHGGKPMPGVKVKVILPAALKDQVPKGSVVFVYARAPGVTAGPPLAVKRFPVSVLPTSFELGDGDMMMGGKLPMMVDLHARVDEDGVATTKTGTEPYAKLARQRRGGPIGRLVLAPRRTP